MTSHLSVEQVEVIRRLRNSGATLQHIADAYQTFDNLDKELGSFGLARTEQNHDSQTNNSPFESPSSNYQISDIISPQKACKKSNHNSRGLSQPSLQDNEASTTNDKIGNIKTLDGQSSQSDETERLPLGVAKEAGKCFLFSLPRECIVDLIKKCSNTHPTCEYFDVNDLYRMFGVTADDVQTFLNGEICKLDKDKQTKFVDWFINILCKADWFIKNVTDYSKDFTAEERSSSGTSYSIEFVPKRERIVFHEIHLAVLESNFKRNHYPTYHEKSLIANECNIKLAISCGRELHEKDRVNAYNVDGWFRNKRKFLIRKNKADPSQAVPLVSQKEERRMEMKLSDIYVSKISNPPTQTGQIYSQSSTVPLNSAPFRPSISIHSRSFNSTFQNQQQLTAEDSFDHNPTINNPTSTENEATNAMVKEEIHSDEERTEEDPFEFGPNPAKSQKLTVSPSLWASN